MTHEKTETFQKEAFEKFRDHIVKTFLDPGKGLAYFDTLKIPRDRVYEIIAPNSFSLIVKGDIKDKERVATFKKLFSQQDGSIEILHEILDSVLPESIKQYKKEIDDLRKTKEWSEISEIAQMDYRRLYNYYVGYFYPTVENLKKLAAIIKPESLQAIAKEIHGEEIKINAITRPVQDQTDLMVRARSLENDAKVYLVNGLLRDLDPGSLMRISKLAIETALDQTNFTKSPDQGDPSI